MAEFENDKKIEREGIGDSLCKEEHRIATVRSECVKDYVLPDYMGDVKKLQRCTAEITPIGHYISTGELGFSSTVTFKILYIDDENILTEATFSEDTECIEKIDERFTDADVESSVVNLSVRLGGPRKITARASVSNEISLAGERSFLPECDLTGCESAQSSIMVHCVEYYKTDEREYAEELDKISGVSKDDVEIVKREALGFIDAVRKTDNGVNISGYIDVTALVRVDEELIRLESRIPVEENLEGCGKERDGVARARCIITDLSVNVNDPSGESVDDVYASVVASVSCECEIAYDYNREESVVTDAFMPGAKNNAEYKKITYNELAFGINEKRKINFIAKREGERIAALVDKEMNLKNVKLQYQGDAVYLSCDAEVTAVFRSDNGEVFQKKFDETVFEKLNRDFPDGDCKTRVRAVPCDVSLSFDTEKIYVEASILVYVLMEREKEIEVLSDLKHEMKDKRGERIVTVYYPEKNETLWSVAKKYSISPDRIALDNKIIESEGVLTPILASKIIISEK